MSDGKYKFISPDGQSMEVELKAGQVLYLDPVEHSTENIGITEGLVLCWSN